ncbi:putative integrase protein [Rhizobium phage RHph_TM3_14A]|nr:putative integrase protein [Rhizobium phage RHph_TM29]QIG67541.1 putative integrase protein [Rhizobium phage RHph_TM3_14A]
MLNSTDHSAKQFLARVVAWPQEGEPPAYVNIHNTFVPADATTLRKDKNGQPIYPWSGIACRSLNEAVKIVTTSATKAHVRDLYFCTSTQRLAEEKVSQKGFKFFKAVRSADNAVKMKSLFLDSDLKDYGTKEEWTKAFAKFLKATGLPRPTIIVFSGGGFHIYWTLVEALTIDKWLPLAYALAEATKREGFKCDTQCTIDSARILRVPGTMNHKYDPPTKVTMLGNPLDFDYMNSKLETALEPYKTPVPYSMLNAAMSILPPKTPLQGTSELSAGIDISNLAPVNLDTILPSCGFLHEAVTTGGAYFNNPLWNLTTLIAVFTEGGRADAHRMACGHSDYGPGETDDLFDRKQEERIKKNMGWPRCATISANGASHCASCPLLAQNKSPLNFAIRPASPTAPQQVGGFSQPINQTANAGSAQGATTPQPGALATLATTLAPSTSNPDPDLPPGYLRNQQGVILRPETEEDGTTSWYPVSRYPMAQPYLLKDPWTLNFTTETEFGRTCQISVPLKDVGTAEMRKAVQEQGLMVMGGQKGFNQLSDFIMAWITKLQSMKDTVVNSSSFGWVTSQGKTSGFVYGGIKHTPNGEEIATPSDPEIGRQMSPCGDKQPWVNAAKMITDQKRPQLDAIIASAFAAPLVRFTGHAGLLMSAYSVESGIGKTTALKIAQAVWGDPVKAIQSLSDTQNSVLAKMGELRSLPMYWDELKSDEDTKRFVDTVFRLTLGKEKSRMTSRVTQRHVGSWETMLVSASNESLLDNIAYKTRATTAGIYRIFEYTVPAARPGTPGQIDPTVAQRMLSKLHDNYGNVGFEYASYLGSNCQQVEKDVGLMLSAISKEVGMKPDERFWVSLIATILLGAKYANALGFTQIDEMRLKAFMFLTLKDMRKTRHAAPVDMRDVVNVVNMLGRFINESRGRHTLVTDVIWKGRGKPPQGAVNVVADASRMEAMHIHIARDDHILRIGQAYFQEWLTKHNYPRHVIIKALEKELGAAIVNSRLGAGTIYANASEYLIEIDLKGSALMNFIDEA